MGCTTSCECFPAKFADASHGFFALRRGNKFGQAENRLPFLPLARSALELLPSSALSSALHIYDTAFSGKFQPPKRGKRTFFHVKGTQRDAKGTKRNALFLPFFPFFVCFCLLFPFLTFNTTAAGPLPQGNVSTRSCQFLAADREHFVNPTHRLYKLFTTARKNPK